MNEMCYIVQLNVALYLYNLYVCDCRPEYDTQSGQDDLVRLTVTLAEEFLNLLIIIISK
jgi:hypothetical protein